MIRYAFFIAALMLLIPVGSAMAHSQRIPSEKRDGLLFDSASHGELTILAEYRSAIQNLAQRSYRADLSSRRLMNYAAIEFTYCLWGLAPHAVEDEGSPFNECTHAYLSAYKALLLRMRTLPVVKQEAEMLVSQIDAEVVASGAMFIGCAYTGEQFTTAELVTPRWELLPAHMPSLAATLAAVLFISVPAIVPRFSKLRHSRKENSDLS